MNALITYVTDKAMKLTTSLSAGKGVTIITHACCWALYITYEMISLIGMHQVLAPAYVYVAYYMVNIGFFYGTAATLYAIFTVKRWSIAGGFIRYAGLSVIYLLIKLIISAFIENHLSVLLRFTDNLQFVFPWLFRSWYFALLGGFYWATNHFAVYRLKLASLEAAYLRQRISPHLLFNSLNFIYSGVQECSEDAANAVLLLSDLMRSSLAGPGSDGKIALGQELTQVNRLIQLNRLRFAGRTLVDSSVGEGKDKFRIAPLILVTLTENMFKHGDLSGKGQPAHLAISVSDDGQLLWRSSNRKIREKESPGTGLGLGYVRDRLEQFYRGKYTLEIEATEIDYQVKMTIWL
ncbi:sensor histidine kinase [Mucilaginibacter sp. L3T2-6]|uniref:sensor histidine kinase n=1 Tax=Mucilaginibacter sp. L3T2-6 TaxID=3062491 RepID=UPI0026770637|nr:histidine kinase [Mucilaginibacter sp. L3T2-6]MDO3641250.1 histidine kinase [Mucilaginibacter sp. L3T2-6]MDV6213990.1 histidine kinase [Mucilaginibacter sp. L3T2-6]